MQRFACAFLGLHAVMCCAFSAASMWISAHIVHTSPNSWWQENNKQQEKQKDEDEDMRQTCFTVIRLLHRGVICFSNHFPTHRLSVAITFCRFFFPDIHITCSDFCHASGLPGYHCGGQERCANSTWGAWLCAAGAVFAAGMDISSSLLPQPPEPSGDEELPDSGYASKGARRACHILVWRSCFGWSDVAARRSSPRQLPRSAQSEQGCVEQGVGQVAICGCSLCCSAAELLGFPSRQCLWRYCILVAGFHADLRRCSAQRVSVEAHWCIVHCSSSGRWAAVLGIHSKWL